MFIFFLALFLTVADLIRCCSRCRWSSLNLCRVITEKKPNIMNPSFPIKLVFKRVFPEWEYLLNAYWLYFRMRLQKLCDSEISSKVPSVGLNVSSRKWWRIDMNEIFSSKTIDNRCQSHSSLYWFEPNLTSGILT